MTDRSIIYQIKLLPENLKQEVMDFIGFLMTKYDIKQEAQKSPVFGSAKGKYVLADDFDEPLEDFKDYM